MEITQTNSDGLKRTLKVVIGAGELNQRFAQRVDAVKDSVQLKGFRKGKVPAAHIKKVYGRSLMAEVLEETVRETSSKALADRKERPALQPDIKLPEDKDEIERVIDGKADLAYSMTFEVIPEIPVADLSGIKLERLTADVDDAARDKALTALAERSVSYVAEDGRAATDKDRVIVDFVGKIDGEPFEGGTAEGAGVVVGAGNFIPGFEDGIRGAKAGDERMVTAKFPDEYPVQTLAGKEATFDVKVKAVEAPKVPAIDDELAKSLGIEDLAKLKEVVSDQIKRGYDDASRTKLKRELLDALEKAHTFELPPTLVETEFNQIWTQLTNSMKAQNRAFPDEGKSEDEVKAEYRKIAERRVRLGLVIGEIGEKNEITVSQDELRRALIEQARRYPGQEKMVYEYFEKTPGALAELRAPIFEDKVVDFILDKAKPTERKISSEELLKQVEEATMG